MADFIDKERLLAEISRRVIELDAKREFDQDLHNSVLAYIEALDEITGLNKVDIEVIARQVITEYELPQPRASSSKMYLGGAAVVIVMLMLAIFTGKYLGLKEGIVSPPADNQVNKRAEIIRAKLGQVLTLISPIKLVALEHYMTTLKFPTNFAEVGFNQVDYLDADLIKDITFTPTGGIMVHLGEGFDPNAKILLQSDAFEGRDIVRWQCLTNIAQKYLGAVKASPCVFDSSLN